MNYPREKPKKRDRWQLFNDKLDETAIDAATAETIVQMKRAMESNPNRLLKTLVKEEVRNIAIGALSGYVKKRAEQAEAVKRLNDGLPEIML